MYILLTVKKLIYKPVGAFLDELDKRQSKFLRQCPEVEKRFDTCLYTSYGDLCFYSDEWVCNMRCISKSNVCHPPTKVVKQLNNGGHINEEKQNGKCHWGMKKCGEERCVSRYTPCNGVCWSEANPSLCGNNLCLSENQLRVSVNHDW